MPVGNLLATIVLLVLSSTLSNEAFLAWGWRVGFWLSVVIVIVGYYIEAAFPMPLSSRKPRLSWSRMRPPDTVSPRSSALPTWCLHRHGPTFLAIDHQRHCCDLLHHLYGHAAEDGYLYHPGDDAVLTLFTPSWFLWWADSPIVRRTTSGLRCRYDPHGRGVVAFPMFNTANDAIILATIVLGLAVHALMYAGQPAIMAERCSQRGCATRAFRWATR